MPPFAAAKLCAACVQPLSCDSDTSFLLGSDESGTYAMGGGVRVNAQRRDVQMALQCCALSASQLATPIPGSFRTCGTVSVKVSV